MRLRMKCPILLDGSLVSSALRAPSIAAPEATFSSVPAASFSKTSLCEIFSLFGADRRSMTSPSPMMSNSVFSFSFSMGIPP